ncbi:GlxA family transcriptional regulator [Labrys okinawensis]|uniref:GlxA family transcriptional regulator n=1 Tax=Labrys okinawensis TaxID=346911 RepID=UPI0039BCC920
MKIAILVLDHVFDTALAAILDVLTTANDLSGEERFTVRLIGLRNEAVSAQGFRIPLQVAASDMVFDWVLVPAIGHKMPEALRTALALPDIASAGALLRAWSKDGAAIAASCIATFVLAESGLLDGEHATTSWWLAPFFRERYPQVQLEPDRIIVPSGAFLTAGAALSVVDMVLWLIRRSSPDLADLVARYLIIDTRPSQSAYVIPDHLAHADPLVSRFDRWVRDHLDSALTLEAAAEALASSKRTLARRVRDVLGKTPVEYIQDLRMERAVHLLRTGTESVDAIARKVGYAEGSTLRTLLRRRLGRGVREIRRRVG